MGFESIRLPACCATNNILNNHQLKLVGHLLCLWPLMIEEG